MSRFIVTADWENNAPHLTTEAKKDLYDSIPAYQKDARTRGIPQLGAGIIYPIPEDDIVVDDFPLPPHWPRGYGLDVGWNRTAGLFVAKNPDTGVRYFYDEYYRGEADPEVHAAALRRRCSLHSSGRATEQPWIPGRIDPAARGRSQADGEQLLKLYRELVYGQDLLLGTQLLKVANNAVETGIYEVLMALQQGRLKVFKRACRNWLAERRLYRRDEKGRIVKKNDHAQDAGRYGIASGETWLVQEPAPQVTVMDPAAAFAGGAAGYGWMNV